MFFVTINTSLTYSDLLGMEHSEFIEWVKLTDEYVKNTKKQLGK